MRTTEMTFMDAATYQGYLISVARYMTTWSRSSEPRRMGQSYFNVLDIYFPRIADRIRGSEYDPFYEDIRIGQFLAHLYTAYVR